MTTKKKATLKPLAQSPEYMRRYRLKHNPDVRQRICVKVKNYPTDAQAKKIEKFVNELIGWED